jgi:hypothetical protein
MNFLFIIISLFILSLYSILYFTDRSGLFVNSDLVYLLAPLLEISIGIYAINSIGKGGKRNLSLLWLLAGIFCDLIGEGIWFYFAHVANIAPAVSIADVFFLLSYPCYLIGVHYEFKLNKVPNIKDLIRSPVFYPLIICMGLVCYFGIYKAIISGDNSFEGSVAGGYGLGDLILVISAFFIFSEYNGGVLRQPWMYIGIGFICDALADVGQSIFAVDFYTFILNIFWILGYLSVGYGMLQFALISTNTQKELEQQLLTLKNKRELPEK